MVSTEKSKRQKETKHEQIRIREIKRVVADEFRGDPPPPLGLRQAKSEMKDKNVCGTSRKNLKLN